MNLSVCIITRNEEKKLKRCLESIAAYGFEIVVVDTGSTDHTCELVRAYTDRLYQMDWQDDFALAKNTAIAYASHDLVLILDSDEYLLPLSENALQTLEALTLAHPDAIGRIYRINEVETAGELRDNYEWINRLFSKSRYHYEGRIHEQVTRLSGQDAGGVVPMYQTPICIRHDGYLGTAEQKKKKAARNISLLKKELEAGEDPYILYQLGKSHYTIGEYMQAADYFDRALYYDLDPELEYVIDLVETYGYALMNSGQLQKAQTLESVYGEFGRRADFQFLMGLIYMKSARFDEAVTEFQKAAEQKSARMEGVNSYLAWYNIGVIYECLGAQEKAEIYYRRALPYEKARKRLEEMDVSEKR